MSNTPILDCEQPVPAVKVHRLLSVFLGLVLGIVLIESERSGLLGQGAFLNFLSSPARLIGCLVAFYIAVLLHELGHVGAAMATGFELRGLAVGLFLLSRKASGWRFQIVPRRIFYGGLTSVVPRYAENLRGRYIRLVLGGPATTVILFLIALLSPGGLWVSVFLFANLLLTLSCCIPYTARGLPSDAKAALVLARKGAEADRLVAILYLLSLDGQGVQPRDWPPEFVERMNISSTETSYLTLSLALQYANALEGEDHDTAAKVLESALKWSTKMLPDAQRGFFVAASCFQGIFRNNASPAEAWLESAAK